MPDEPKKEQNIAQAPPVVDANPAQASADEPKKPDPGAVPQHEEAAAPQTAPVQEHLDDRVRELALNLGWSEEDIAAYPSSAHLARAVNAEHRRLAERLPKPEAAAPAAGTPTAAQTQPQTAAPAAPVATGWTPKISADDNPDLYEDLRGLHNHVLGQSAKATSELGGQLAELKGMVGFLSKRVAEADQRELDQCLAHLPNDLAAIYGRSPARRGNAERAAKLNPLIQTMGTIAQARLAAGHDLPSITDLFDAATYMLHPDILFKQQLRQAADSLEPLDEVSLRPGARQEAPEQQGRHAAAVAFARDFAKRKSE